MSYKTTIFGMVSTICALLPLSLYAAEDVRVTKSAEIVWASCDRMQFSHVNVEDGYFLVIANMDFERSYARGVPLAIKSELLEPLCSQIREHFQPNVTLHIKNLDTSGNGGGEIIKLDLAR